MAERRLAGLFAALAMLALPGAALPQPGLPLCGGGSHRPDLPVPGKAPPDCGKACHAVCERHRRLAVASEPSA
jgi:hypothetical protein